MSSKIALSKITLKAGPDPRKGPLEFEPGTVLLFVGPNNSGKSLTLREIEGWCIGQGRSSKMVHAVEFEYPTDPEEALQLALEFKSSPPPHQQETEESLWLKQQFPLRPDQPEQTPIQSHKESFKKAVKNRIHSDVRRWLISFYTVRLDGRTRFWLIEPKLTGDLRSVPQNHLWALFTNDVAREQVRQLTYEAFGLYFVIDPTEMQNFTVRMSPRAPTSKAEEQGLDQAALAFHAQATPINQLGDGVQAFVGLVSAVFSLPHRIILIDEPEAFLHPPLARRLGSSLASIAEQRGASLVTATHSADFLMGCLEAVGKTSVIRLTYESGVATARSLSAIDLSTMTRDPLLRSTGLLRALFHRAAVITEADSDRAFYDEINRRMLIVGRGVSDVLFLNAQSKDTVCRLVKPLRQIGIPAAAIVDLDFLEQGGGKWRALLDACQVPTGQRASLEQERQYIANIFSSAGIQGKARPIASKGLHYLNPSDKARAQTLLDALSQYGLFLVPGGELESWLSSFGITKHGSDWLIEIFGQIGQADTDANYLKPGKDDVWEFLEKIALWINDPNRLGTD